MIPVTALVALSVAYSIFEPLHRAALLATAFILIQYLLTSPLPLLGILSLAIVHHHIKNTLLPTQENKTEIPRGSQPRKSNFFGQVITYSPFSYAPILSLFRHDDDPFDGSDTYFIDINGST
jgi:hypothetical protein